MIQNASLSEEKRIDIIKVLLKQNLFQEMIKIKDKLSENFQR